MAGLIVDAGRSPAIAAPLHGQSLPGDASNVCAEPLDGSRHDLFGNTSDRLDHQAGVERDDAIGANPTRRRQRSSQHVRWGEWQAMLGFADAT